MLKYQENELKLFNIFDCLSHIGQYEHMLTSAGKRWELQLSPFFICLCLFTIN